MKKLLTLVTLLMTLLAVPFTASAERSGAKASGVPFNKTKVVYLKSLEKADGEFVKNNPQFSRDEDAVRLTYLGLQKSLKDEGVTLYNNPVMLPDRYLRQTLTMQVVVNFAGTVPLEEKRLRKPSRTNGNLWNPWLPFLSLLRKETHRSTV